MPLALSCLLGVALAAAPDAKALNAEGLRLYKSGEHTAAKEAFAQAVAADDGNAAAHYNLARSLAQLRQAGQTCSHHAEPATIVLHLRRAIELDPERRKRLHKDPALESVRGNLEFQLLTGRRLSKTADLRAILESVQWLGTTTGPQGPTSGIDFAGGGYYTLWQRGVDAENQAQTVQSSGRWQLSGRKVRVWRKDAKGVEQAVDGKLGANGVLELGGLGKYVDAVDECGR